jgi:lipid-A-disaccharide synthase
MIQQRIYIVAGENSGDYHASFVAREFLRRNPGADVRGFGGFKMREAGTYIVSFYQEMAVMGFKETLAKLPTILDKTYMIKLDLKKYKPHVIIFVDFSGFNMKIAKWAQRLDTKLTYYIPPKAWAWNQSRAKKLAKWMDHVFTIFPFEETFFRSYGVKATYVGNPTKYYIDQYNRLDQVIKRRAIALLPGSRQQEIEKNMPIMNELAERMPEFTFFLATTDDFSEGFYHRQITAHNIVMQTSSTFNILSKAHCAVVCSGTATLETALLDVPQVVCYKANKISFAIGKLLVKIKHISLVNILLEREVVREFLQDDFNAVRLEEEVRRLMKPEVAEKMRSDYAELAPMLGDQIPHKRIYDIINPWLPQA